MAMKTKSYSKFMTGAVTAAMVASAVAPVAAAGQDVADTANKSFNDIGPDSSHYVNVIEARELGFLSGYGDGTFKPNKILNRGDVAKMLGKYVVATSGKTLDQYVADNKIADVANFNDVPNNGPDKELVTYSKIVKHANIFQGANNNLMPTKEMNRDQIAAVLVRAFDLKDKSGDTKVVDGANSAYVKEIEILLENGVSNANPYKPFNKTSRAQFASFLVRAYKVSEGMDPTKPLPDPEEPGIDWDGNISIESSKANLNADGKDTAVITFSILDNAGKVDTSADDVVLKLATTHGTFASDRVTVQDGVASATLTSEQSNKNLEALITATVIEAGEGNKEMIGAKASSAKIGFVAYDQAAETLNLTGAESNQTDRLTLSFDRPVKLEDFVQTQAGTNKLMYQIRTAGVWGTPVTEVPADVNREDVRHALKEDAILINGNIGADSENDGILGLKPVQGNNKAIEVILEARPETKELLTKNSTVNVESNFTSLYGKVSKSSTSFVLTDARTPEATSVSNSDLRTIQVKFSESIASANFTVDGQYKNADVEYGEFDATTLEDNRNVAYLTLGEDYSVNTPPTPYGYMAAGLHKVEVSSPTDFAGNVGKTQNLEFTVKANATAPTATVTVASPEQFHVKFNSAIAGVAEAEDFDFEVYNKDTKKWESVGVDLVVSRISATEYKLELPEDWTEIYDTADSNRNYYNDKFQIVYVKEALTNTANGLKNQEPIALDLNYNGSPLNSEDTTSPKIVDIKQVGNSASFVVHTDEPVKLAGEHAEDVGPTPSQDQAAQSDVLPEVKATFYATDYKGDRVTITGNVVGYTDLYNDKIEVAANDVAIDTVTQNGVDIFEEGTYNLQQLVNMGYLGTDFKLSLSQLTDDVGNTADTVSRDFKMAKDVVDPNRTPFFITKAEFGDTANIINVTFSEAVVLTGGANDATKVTQWSLNGKDLPNGTAISVLPGTNNQTVEITLPTENTVVDQISNVITLNREIKSYDGSALVGSNTVELGAPAAAPVAE